MLDLYSVLLVAGFGVLEIDFALGRLLCQAIVFEVVIQAASESFCLFTVRGVVEQGP